MCGSSSTTTCPPLAHWNHVLEISHCVNSNKGDGQSPGLPFGLYSSLMTLFPNPNVCSNICISFVDSVGRSHREELMKVDDVCMELFGQNQMRTYIGKPPAKFSHGRTSTFDII